MHKGHLIREHKQQQMFQCKSVIDQHKWHFPGAPVSFPLHFKLDCNTFVAVHEYANSTSAHDTVLEHRFSPTQTPFTSWQYANERGQGWSCAVSSSRFHTINTACVHTQSCILHHTSEEITPTQQYTKIRIDCITRHATQDIEIKIYKYNLRSQLEIDTSTFYYWYMVAARGDRPTPTEKREY